ncbi:oxaloacetate decarboxylase subunit gamma [Vibrio gallicus]|uniref:oxaloacetate decarboxylase subunit gamma n=1 Tax=Vibrio gallicus TaxID=190897 RepID=UPI0021C2A954|nr:oxaloacetate decarboxylase subunit gamma [Vibrio gallicus]
MNSIVELLREAASIMALGMSMVFLFLTLLVFVVKVMSKFFGPQPMEAKTAPLHPKSNANSLADQNVDPNIVAAISAALHKHRSATPK